MKKHFFNVIAALALVCGVFAFSGCADYETDINNLNERLDNLETGQLSSLEDQVAALSSALDEANGLIDMLQGNVGDLEAADEAMSQQIDNLNGELGNVKNDIAEINSQLTSINTEISSLESELNQKIDDAVAALEAADDANAQRISELSDALATAREELADLIAETQAALEELIKAGDAENSEAIASLSEELTNLTDRVADLELEVDAKYEEINTAISGLSDKLGEHAAQISELFGKYEDLNTRHEQLRSEFDEQVRKLADLYTAVAELEAAVRTLEDLTAGLPALEELVADIRDNYLSKEEAQSTYATLEYVGTVLDSLGKLEGRLEMLESLNIGERLNNLENKYSELNDVIVPGLKEDIAGVLDVANAAQASADEAMEFAKSVFGELELLKEALGTYAEKGALEAKMEALDAMIASLQERDGELNELIEQYYTELDGKIGALDSRIAEQLAGINGSIADLAQRLDDEIGRIEEAMVSHDEFASLFKSELDKALANDGAITEAISKAIETAKLELQSNIDAINTRIDEEILPAIEDLTTRLDEAEDNIGDIKDDIKDLEDRIQSLVFVPEYNDGKATVLSYTINDVAVSDNMVVTATFQVTPAALAENVINQYKENVFAYVLPVLTRSSSDIAYIASAANSSLVLKKGKRDGFIDVEITVPVKTEDGVELTPGGFAISLYVASKEEVDAIVNGEETVVDMDAGTYVSSSYVQTAGKVTALDNAYVLYNEKAEREYPISTDEPESEVNYYERAWSVLDRKVSLYGDNNYDDVDDGSYTLHIKLDDEYYTLEEAAAMFRADVADITPDFDYIAQYYDRYDMANQDIAEYFTVNADEPYGLSIDMAKESAMTDIIGSYVFAMNTFSFDNESRYGNLTVLDNIGRYKVINLPISIDIKADRVDWTYDFALAHANDSDNPAVPNIQPITNTLQYTADNLGALSLTDILALTPVSTEVRLGDSEEPMASVDAPVIAFSNVVSETDTTGTIGISVIKYGFSSKTENVYHFTNTYYLEDYQVNCTVNFTLTLGTMPGDQFVNYGQLPRDIQFMLPGSDDIDIMGIESGYTKAFKQLSKLNPAWFTDEAQLTASMQANDLTKYSSYVDGTVLYDGALHTELSQVYTRLSVEPTAEYADGSFVRVSSSQIKAVGNVFDFVTEVETWYGVTYTFTNSGKVGAPEFELSYIPTHIYDLNGEQPYVQLDYHLNGNGSAYVIDEANLRNYFNVTDIPDGFNGHLTVEFEVLTQENPVAGYANIPLIPVLNVNNMTGALGKFTIDWTRYTARDLQIRATLVASANELTSEKIRLNSLDLNIQVYPLVENAEMKDADDVDYFGDNLEMDGEYIVVNRESNEDVTIRIWEYVNAYARFSNGESFIPYENAKGTRHESLMYVNQNQAMRLYGAELVLDKNYDAVSGGVRRDDIEYSSTDGTVIYRAEDGEIANPIFITIEGHLNYYLDYNHVESYPVTVKIKLQDAE